MSGPDDRAAAEEVAVIFERHLFGKNDTQNRHSMTSLVFLYFVTLDKVPLGCDVMY